MPELVVISGKGGTGKTSMVASLAVLARQAVLADCDVDAADLHLVLEPQIRRRQTFTGGNKARIKPGHCTACGKCEELCRFEAVYFDGPGNGQAPRTFRIDPAACDGCGVCVRFCADNAIEFGPAVDGEWFVSDTRCGPMVHAQLRPGAGNSGKLVSIVRSQAQQIARERGGGLILIDGSPGIGCPVIASITGASRVLAVTEPTLSGEHDLDRVFLLVRHFGIPVTVCVNKCNLNAEIAQRIERKAQAAGAAILPPIPYDSAVTDAQRKGMAVVELGDSPAARAIRQGWSALCQQISIKSMEESKTNPTMKIAIPLAGGCLADHFGHCEQFALIDANPDTKAILQITRVTPPPHEPGLLPRWLHEQGVQVIIAGGMGQRALSLFAENGITVRSGLPGRTAEESAKAFLEGGLSSGPAACERHERGCHG